MPGCVVSLMFCRSSSAGQDHCGRSVHRTARNRPGQVSPRGNRLDARHRRRQDQLGSPHGRSARRPVEVAGEDSRVVDRRHGGGPRHCACEVERTPRCRRGSSRLSQEHGRLLRRSGQDPRRVGVGLVRADHRRPYGQLCRRVPGRGGQHGDVGQGQPLQGGDRCVSAQRRVLPRIHRWSGGALGHRLHSQGRGARVRRVGYGSRVAHRSRGLPRVHRGRRQGQ